MAAGRGSGIPLGEAASAGEVFMEIGGAGGNEPTEPADHEIRLIRQEFEANLVEAGLEIERDRDVSLFMVIITSTNIALLDIYQTCCYFCIHLRLCF